MIPQPQAQRLAIVVSHPIQYYAPWFRHLAQQPDLEVRVFHLWDFGVTAQVDPGFGHPVQWDIPLLEGYASEFVPNLSAEPGTHHFHGLDNPELVPRLQAWKPDAILLFGYAYRSHLRVILSRRLRSIPLLFRGDSHDLARSRGLRTRLGRAVRQLLFPRFAAFLSVGKAHTNYLLNSRVPERRIHRSPHCVDNARFQEAASDAEAQASRWKDELGIPPEALVVLFAGKLEAVKRPLDLLEAFLSLPSRRVEAGSAEPVLLYVGSGTLEQHLRARAGDRLGHSVFMTPFQNQSRMPVVYAASDLLVLPSASETWGLAVNEAMNLARPVLVSDGVGCAPDLVVPGQTGWTYPAGDREALAAVLQEALALGRGGLRARGLEARSRMAGWSFQEATRGLRSALRAVLGKELREP